jgi:hypothetical protein
MGYESASTVEVIVDMLSSAFNFMEMNTWLQVTQSFYLIIFFKNLCHHVIAQSSSLFDLQLWSFLCYLNLHQIQGFVFVKNLVY